jgi:hypothetical protein
MLLLMTSSGMTRRVVEEGSSAEARADMASSSLGNTWYTATPTCKTTEQQHV